MKKVWLIVLAVVIVLSAIIFFAKSGEKGDVGEVANMDLSEENVIGDDNVRILMKTNMGDIELVLYEDKVPNTVVNFVELAGRGFYDDTRFHRVIDGFMIQGGDPNTKGGENRDKVNEEGAWGTGGPGYFFADEFAEGLSNLRGTIAMANSGPNTNGSQFFINVADNLFLDGKHSVFGEVVDGMDVVDMIAKVQTGAFDRPLDDVILEEVVVN